MNDALITKELLDEFGITVAEADLENFLAHANQTLDERVGAEIADSLDDEQLAVLANLQESNDDEAVSAWLEQHVPELAQIAQDEIDILLGELAESSDALNAA